jgi:TMEM175 potassium channel family protein
MGKGRLEAFSDGVIAVIITIMVLELHAPHGADLDALRSMAPGFAAYVLSFVFVGIYWNNHHHMLHAATKVNGKVLWANLHLLFWLSLIPFVTGWLGEHHDEGLPTAIYGGVMLASGVSYLFLEHALIGAEGPGSKIATAMGDKAKEKMSTAAYVLAIPCAFWQPLVSDGLFVAVAAIWLIPDRRIEALLGGERE